MGYRGDVLPMVPVARELAHRGHGVRFVCPREFHPLFDGEPFACVHSGTDLGPRLLDEHAGFVARWGTTFGGALLPRLYFDKLTIPFLDNLFEVIDQELADADLVASHPFPFLVAGPAAERRGVRTAVLDLFPMLMPSRFTSLPGAPSLPPRLNALGWGLLRSRPIQRFPTFAKIRAFRARLGLAVDDWSFFDACRSKLCTIGLYSRWYQPRQPDWPDSYHLAGFTPWLGRAREPLPHEVEDFLCAGDPPVLVTLGTNAASAHPEAFIAASDALRRVGARALVLASNEAIAERVRPRLAPGHGVWPFLPLGPLLSRCRAIVHAGGHGTNAAVFSAGIPAAITPAVTDQIWHARRIEQLGIGVRVKRGRLHRAVADLVTDPNLSTRARDFGEHIRAEDGPCRAADLIDDALASSRT